MDCDRVTKTTKFILEHIHIMIVKKKYRSKINISIAVFFLNVQIGSSFYQIIVVYIGFTIVIYGSLTIVI